MRIRRGSLTIPALVLGFALFFTGQTLIGTEYEFICSNEGLGLSVVDVLQATGDHTTFLHLFSQYDPEGYAILADPQLADKTVWAPTDRAFLAISDTLASLSDEQIKAILGYHISPPRRAPWGSYPIVTPQLLTNGGKMVHRTRTGVLTGADHRTQTSVVNGRLVIENAQILGTVWCTEAGSVFSLDSVITAVVPPSPIVRMWYRLIQILLYEDIRFVIYSTLGAMILGSMVSWVIQRGQSLSPGPPAQK
ncbi:MAG: hypothetical protein GW949_08905 [Spirochaetales bacterium]|nr:hypothetical protein [Spirochaetales bacterium]